MPGPFEATGAQKGATRFGALGMGARQFTGLVTQRSPYRDGAVPYLVGKFYGGSRFDSIWDGINREITQRLTDARAPGSSVYNSNTFPAANSLYPWKYIQNAAEIVRVIYDGKDGTIYDATAGQKTALFAKGAGAGKARFLGVNTELFFGDGVETKKILRSAKTWMPNTVYNVGDFIIDPAGNIQSVQANPKTYTLSLSAVIDALGQTYAVLTAAPPIPQIPVNQTMTFAGLTHLPGLNGDTIMWQGYSVGAAAILNLNAGQVAFATAIGATAQAAETGTMVALTGEPGTTGGTQPTWGTAFGNVVNDGGLVAGVNWTCFGPAVENWGIASVPAAPPVYDAENLILIDPVGPVRYWVPQLTYGAGTITAIRDSNGNIQVANNGTGSPWIAGTVVPNWATQVGSLTQDGAVSWICYGPVAAWYADTTYGGATAGVGNPCVVLDVNGNLQATQDLITALVSGTTQPTWATTVGATTTDGAITWVCLGAGSVLWQGAFQYAWSPVGIDGSVGTATPITLVAAGGLGPTNSFQLELIIEISGTAAETDPQVAKLKIWRTAQGQSTLIQLDEIPNPFLLGQIDATYMDVSSDLQLNAFIPAPVAEANDPPPANLTAPVYFQQRVWGIVDNMVVHSGGPDTITGNGNTAFAPLDEIPFLAQPVKLVPVLVQNGGLIVMTTDGIKIILGTGTPSNPYYVGDYLELVSILNYDAVTVFYNQIFCMESNGKVSSLAIEYPFNPQSGYTEVGFPIGDQFVKVTTGGQDAALFNPASSFVSWNAHSSADTGMYVSDGTGFWFRMSLINPPESGILWSPLRQLQGGASAVQSIETSPGVRNLLIAPPDGTPGPILMRDTTGAVWTDRPAGVATPYPAWDAKGVTLLCSTGQSATLKHVAAKSVNTGGPRPVVGILFNEIEPSAERPYIEMTLKGKGNDPPHNSPSLSVYSDRYRLAQQGQDVSGDCVLVKFDYGVQAFGDELLDWALYGKVTEEDEEQAEKA